jgi:hypothetical protein
LTFLALQYFFLQAFDLIRVYLCKLVAKAFSFDAIPSQEAAH